MMPHDDQIQDVDMIKTVLQKIIDEMTDMESQRILPDGHPSKHVEIAAKVEPAEGSPEEESMEFPDQESSEHDDGALSGLLDKAGQADDSGAMPEDHEEDLPPEIAALVAEKRKKLQ